MNPETTDKPFIMKGRELTCGAYLSETSDLRCGRVAFHYGQHEPSAEVLERYRRDFPGMGL